MENIILGTKYYKVEDDTLTILRVVKNKDPKNIELFNDDNEKSITMGSDILLEYYTKLNPDAIINFSIVKIQNIEDVIVSVFRKEEINNMDTTPYSICRQNITDFFANSLSPDMNYAGINVTKETIPQDVSMVQLSACDQLESNISVSYYMGDKLDRILSYFKSKIYDNILYSLFIERIRYKSKSNGGKMYITYAEKKNHVDGYCKTLKELLTYNNFMYDLMRGFNIYPLDINLTNDNEQHLSIDNINVIERLVCKNIVAGPKGSIVIKYDKDIDLDEIKQEYILICDRFDNLYIVTFKTYGKYHIPVEKLESSENIELMAKSINFNKNSSITEAYEYIRFNSDKYKL